MNNKNRKVKNPQLEGNSFFWKAGSVGILLSHGYTATTAEVRLLAKKLYDENFTISSPLLPGHNSRPEELNSVHWQDWYSTLEEQLIQLRINCSTVFVGGESVGGLLALHLASQYPDIAGILAYAPALRYRISSWDIIKLKLASPFIPYVQKRKRDDDLAWQGYTVYPLKGLGETLKLQKITLKNLHLVNQPILIIQGRSDYSIHPTVPGYILSHVCSNHKEIHWMPQSAHCVILDKEIDEVAIITTRFIKFVLTIRSQK